MTTTRANNSAHLDEVPEPDDVVGVEAEVCGAQRVLGDVRLKVEDGFKANGKVGNVT